MKIDTYHQFVFIFNWISSYRYDTQHNDKYAFNYSSYFIRKIRFEFIFLKKKYYINCLKYTLSSKIDHK